MIVKLFTLPDKSPVEKKVQELETILSALQKNSVRAIIFFIFFFYESIGHRAELKLSRHLPNCIVCYLFPGLLSSFFFGLIESEISEQESRQLATEEPNKGL